MKNLTIAFLTAASLFTFGCGKKGDDVAEFVGKAEKLAEEMCKCTDKACADKVDAERQAFMEDGKKRMSGKSADDTTKQKMRTARDKYNECKDKLEAVVPDGGDKAAEGDQPAEGQAAEGDKAAEGQAAEGDKAAEGAAAAAAAGDLPEACQEYKAAIENLAKCDKLPPEAKEGMTKSFEQAWASWANLPAEAKASLGDMCKTASESVKQAAAACN